jgi:hypothetical protein
MYTYGCMYGCVNQALCSLKSKVVAAIDQRGLKQAWKMGYRR